MGTSSIGQSHALGFWFAPEAARGFSLKELDLMVLMGPFQLQVFSGEGGQITLVVLEGMRRGFMCTLLSGRVCGEVWTSWELPGLEGALVLALEAVVLLRFPDGEIKVQE